MSDATDLISLEMLRQLLVVQTGLCDGLKAQQEKIRARMIELVYQYAPDEADRLARTARPLERMRDEDLLERIRMVLEKGQAGAGQQGTGENLADILQQRDAQIEAQRVLISQIEADKERIEQQVIQLTSQLAATQQILSQNQTNPPKDVENPTAGNTAPEWFSSWKGGRGYENEAILVRLLGDSGISRRPALVELANKTNQISPSTFHSALDRLLERGLVKKVDAAGQKKAGNSPEPPASGADEKPLSIDILLLTDLGQEAYQRLTGKAPSESEFSIFNHHSSPEHAILILEAADVLIAEGYQILQRDVRNIDLPNGASVRPDLAVQDPDGQVIFIEVERDTYKGSARADKWRNLHAATGGKLYIVCDTHACLCSVRNETNEVLDKLAYTRWLTDLRSLRGNPSKNTPPRRNARDGSMWIEKKVTT